VRQSEPPRQVRRLCSARAAVGSAAKGAQPEPLGFLVGEQRGDATMAPVVATVEARDRARRPPAMRIMEDVQRTATVPASRSTAINPSRSAAAITRSVKPCCREGIDRGHGTTAQPLQKFVLCPRLPSRHAASARSEDRCSAAPVDEAVPMAPARDGFAVRGQEVSGFVKLSRASPN
jgi:hypothetical protein